MSSPTVERELYSRVYSRILILLVLIQLVIALTAGLQTRSLRAFNATLLEQHAAWIHYDERLAELEDELRSSGEMDEPGEGVAEVSRQRARAGHLSSILDRLSQENPTVSREDLASAHMLAQGFRKIAAGSASASKQSDLLLKATDDLHAWQSSSNRVELRYDHQLAANKHAYWAVELGAVLAPGFVLATLLCVMMLRRDARRQAARRQVMEDELRQERSRLEERIRERTAELQSEVAERVRAEALNRGRNQLLEMITREEPARDVFQVLVDVVAKERRRWGCALHLVDSGELRLETSCGLPASLMRSLQQLEISMKDAPETTALRERKPQVFEHLALERRPWPHLLHAHGIQSLWSVPIYAPQGAPLGTLTTYSFLRSSPSQVELDLLESHSQMASMVLVRYRLQEELRRHAYHDSLTGLPNRLLGEEQLAAAIRRAERSGRPAAVLWIDLNKFKQTNDVHGHLAGDALLKEIASRLARRFRGSDLIARMGGDEFMAVLQEVSGREEVEQIALELTAELAAPVPFQGIVLNTAASIGCSMYPEDGETADLLQRNADLAMYEAKFGELGVRSYSSALNTVLTERRRLETAMTKALEEGGFQLHYQPQYGKNGRLEGFEALLRYSHPEMGMISPARLIAIAEESHMIVALGEWVLREACQQHRRWSRAGLPLVPVAVNISAVQFAREDFADQVAKALHETGMPPEMLELELTESVMVKDFAESARQLKRLKSLGVQIALDDFGTGYSSLNQLHRLPIDRLKIDRSFTEALDKPRGTLPIVEGIITMAHRMGMRVVAEGVETKEQMEVLRAYGADVLQGFLFSRALDAEAAALLLRRQVDAKLVQQRGAGERQVELAMHS